MCYNLTPSSLSSASSTSSTQEETHQNQQSAGGDAFQVLPGTATASSPDPHNVYCRHPTKCQADKVTCGVVTFPIIVSSHNKWGQKPKNYFWIHESLLKMKMEMLKYTFVQSLVVLDGGCDGVQVSDCDNHHKEKYTLDQPLGNHYSPFWKHIQGNLKVSWCDWILVHLRDNTMMDVGKYTAVQPDA